MKKIAVIILFLFALVQAAPAFCSSFSPATSVFMVDEKIEKEDYTVFLKSANEFFYRINNPVLFVERLHAAPCLEKLTPPPIFS